MKNRPIQLVLKVIAISAFCLIAAVYALNAGKPRGQTVVGKPADSVVPALSRGAFIWRSDVLEQLDKLSEDGDCKTSGPLAFGCLIQQIVDPAEVQRAGGKLSNPFNLSVTAQIKKTIEGDLIGFRTKPPVGLDSTVSADQQLNIGFLTDPGSRMQLVGITNRMDRKFINDIEFGPKDRFRCGEINLVYRFRYSIKDGTIFSRLPVTMNVIFPVIPKSKETASGAELRGICRDIARRWVDELERSEDRPVDEQVRELSDPETGIIAPLDGRNIDRIEMNMQVFRIAASGDESDLGSSADYVIRAFRWNRDTKVFAPSFLIDQIDRARILGDADGDDNSCDPGKVKQISRQEFVKYLLDPVVLSDIDSGALNIPKKYLACRAVSGSPGGPHRSKNNLFWNAAASTDPSVRQKEQIVTDQEILTALKNATSPKRQFSYMRSADDFRLRLSEQSCTGCHQARAIAGFHFPGADRDDGTASSNAVFIPGSPHFYGDQPRRRQVIKWISEGKDPSTYEMAPSYASRPANRFKPDFLGTQFIGGWGSACMVTENRAKSLRKWNCQDGLKCQALFESTNAPGMGTCVPDGRVEIGDALQTGVISSSGFARDQYLRTTPAREGDWKNRATRDTRITDEYLADFLGKNGGIPAAPGNAYFGSHQEYFQGVGPNPACASAADPKKCFSEQRDRLTGGFSGGMLRLSECLGLPSEATCGLVASSGFNDCLSVAASPGGGKTLNQCFVERTSYAGLRACDIGDPCRDDYICLRPIGYNLSNGESSFKERQKNILYSPLDFGQQQPDQAWLGRNNGAGDSRGICIPPYFVFQFRADGHPKP